MMSAAREQIEPDLRMTREEYLAWAEGRPGRYERVHGVVVSMAPERSEHALAKAKVWDALRQAIRTAGLRCTAYPDGMTVQVDLHQDRPIGVRLPETVVLAVTDADAVIKGQTASSSYKNAVLENGLRILVPPFITAGEKVVVNTNDVAYVRRAE